MPMALGSHPERLREALAVTLWDAPSVRPKYRGFLCRCGWAVECLNASNPKVENDPQRRCRCGPDQP